MKTVSNNTIRMLTSGVATRSHPFGCCCSWCCVSIYAQVVYEIGRWQAYLTDCLGTLYGNDSIDHRLMLQFFDEVEQERRNEAARTVQLDVYTHNTNEPLATAEPGKHQHIPEHTCTACTYHSVLALLQ